MVETWHDAPASSLPAIPHVLSIAGTDPTGGAGIQADLKAIAANRGYGMAVVTALVAQNTRGVRSVHAPDTGFLLEQLQAVSDDVPPHAVKLGMLFNADTVTTVGGWLAEHRPPAVVLDPVMVSTSGHHLLDPTARQGVRDLLGHVDLTTPNLPELAALLDEPVAQDWPQALAQAERLARRHDVRVLAKGGHLAGPESPDALVDHTGVVEQFDSVRVPTHNTHGTGCSLSSAIATWLARTGDLSLSVRASKAWLTDSLRGADALGVGQGHGPVHHFATLWAGQPDPWQDLVAGASLART